MSYPVGSGVIEYHFSVAGTDRPMVSTVGIALSDDLDAGNMEAIHGAWVTALQAELDNVYTFEGITARWTSLVSDMEAEYFDAAPGLRSGDGLVINTSVLVRKNTGVAGRANRGRNYWPGFLNEADTGTSGVVVGSRVTDLQAAFQDWFDNTKGVLTAIDDIVIQHANGDPVTVVNTITVEALAATQRRRLR